MKPKPINWNSVSSFNRHADTVREAIKKALEPFGIEVGPITKFSIGSSGWCELPLVLTCEQGRKNAGSMSSPEADDFKMHAASYGLRQEDLGRDFISGDQWYTLIGSISRGWKYPLLGKQRSTGKVYKFTAHHVLASFKQLEAEAASEAAVESRLS